MSEIENSNNYEFLAKLPIFDRLTEDEVRDLAAISHEFSFQQDSIIAYQRDVATSFYLVKSGRLYAQQVGKNGEIRDSKIYEAGDHIEDKWLFEQLPHLHTIRGTEDGRLLTISQAEFLIFLKNHPGSFDGLKPFYENEKLVAGLSEEAWQMATRTSISADKTTLSLGLMPDELLEFYAHRSRYYLLVQMITPTVLLFAAFTLAGILLVGNGFGEKYQWANVGVSALIFIIPIALSLFRFLDWRNDYFLITNKHLTHYEFDLKKLRSHVDKVPIDQIQSISTLKPSFFANFFNYGTARITTSSQTGTVYFDNIDQPKRVTETLERLKKHSQELTEGLIQAAMRDSLESHFDIAPSYQEVDIEREGIVDEGAEGALETLRRRFKKRYGTHLVEDDVIYYRKNIFAFLRVITLPLLLNILLVLVLGYLISMLNISLLITLPVAIIIMLASLFWLIWKVEDWRNDTFQLTNQFVIDIDRKPFGLGEARKQADLGNVQNITSNKPTLWATLFNYGDVHVETAGAQSDIVFEKISHPNRVQSEIFQRREHRKKLMKINEGVQRRREYAVLMDVYQQAQEQNRIPRRTPE